MKEIKCSLCQRYFLELDINCIRWKEAENEYICDKCLLTEYRAGRNFDNMIGFNEAPPSKVMDGLRNHLQVWFGELALDVNFCEREASRSWCEDMERLNLLRRKYVNEYKNENYDRLPFSDSQSQN